MQQGLLYRLLVIALMCFSYVSHAIELTKQQAESLLQSESVQQVVQQLYQQAVRDEIPQLEQQFNAIPLPNREAVSYVLLKKIEARHLILTLRLANFIQVQTRVTPIYTVTEYGDGYQAVMPAFSYRLIAKRLMRQWKKDQAVLMFVLAVEQHDLNLAEFLGDDQTKVAENESLLLAEMAGLSPSAIEYLVEQIVAKPIVSWLPSSQVMVKLAQVSQDERLYNLLWRMKNDDQVLAEVRRLGQQADSFATQQLMAASKNSSLKSSAIDQLVRIKPMSSEVRLFLLTKLNQQSDGVMVATALVDGGYRDWLMGLLSHNLSSQQRSHVQAALAQNSHN